MIRYDYIIIGGGPGGYTLAAGLTGAGRKVALVERDRLGGTCLNRGCIPTKCLCATADAAVATRHAAEFGVLCGEVSVDYAKAHERMLAVVGQLGEGVERAVSGAGLYRGEARLITLDAQPEDGMPTRPSDGRPVAVQVGDEILAAPNIVIATGSQPALLPIPGAETALTSDGFLSLTELPASAVIIGGGVIGIEFASILASLGCQVTVVEYLPEILPVLDADVAKRLRTMLTRRGIKFVLGAKVTAVVDGRSVQYEAKRGAAEVSADCVVMAVGRRPVVPEGCAQAGIGLDRRGFIEVDDAMSTCLKGIYAIGDVNGRCLLAHAAEAQAEVLMGHEVNMDLMPSAVFCKPEAASVGLGEDECKRRGLPCRVLRSNYAANGKALAMGEPDGMVKLTVDPDSERLLGVQIIGAHAADLLAEATALLSARATLTDLTQGMITAHPTLPEILRSAR